MKDPYVINMFKDYKITVKEFILLSHIGNYLALHKGTVSWSKMLFPQVLYKWFYCLQVSCVSDKSSDACDCRKSVKEALSVVTKGISIYP